MSQHFNSNLFNAKELSVSRKKCGMRVYACRTGKECTREAKGWHEKEGMLSLSP
jgi:hypothetical protein